MDDKALSRRELLRVGLITGVTSAIGFTVGACTSTTANPVTPGGGGGGASPAPGASSPSDMAFDNAILNAAIDAEQRAIWAYNTAAGTGKLNGTDPVSMLVKARAIRNRDDHVAHRDALAAAVRSMGGTPTPEKNQYDLSAYLNANEGNLNDVAGIARLALALEVDAALLYQANVPKFKNPSLHTTGWTIMPDEAVHAAVIRELLREAGVLKSEEAVTPSPFISPATRSAWVMVG